MSSTSQSPTAALPRQTWSARVFSLPVILALLLIYVVFYGAAAHGVADPDIWWHMRNARELLQTGHFVRADSWTFTVAGKPWINFEWLSELPWYWAYMRWGVTGLYWVMSLLVAAITVGTFWLSWLRSRDWLASFLVSLLATHFFAVSMGPRTLLFGWLLLLVELAILWQLREGRDHTAWLPALFLLWINVHGSWFIGFVLMVLFFACGWLGGEWGRVTATRWEPRQKRKLLLVTAACFAVLFVNPYGWRLVAYPVQAILGGKLGTQYITEWASLDFHGELGKEVLAMILGFSVLQLVRPRRWPLQDVLFALIAVYASFTYVRFVFMGGILLIPMLAIDCRLPPEKHSGKKTIDTRWLSAGAMAIVLVLMARSIPSAKQLQASIAQDFPGKAIPYVRSLAGRGPLFNEYMWGGYLEWYAPEVKEFVDPRADIFAASGVMADYVHAVRLKDTFEVLDKYHIRFVLLKREEPMAYLLEHNPGWRVTWNGQQAVVLERVP